MHTFHFDRMLCSLSSENIQRTRITASFTIRKMGYFVLLEKL